MVTIHRVKFEYCMQSDFHSYGIRNIYLYSNRNDYSYRMQQNKYGNGTS